LARWLQAKRHSLAHLNQSLQLQYVRDQLDYPPQPAPQTINHRLCVLGALYRYHYGHEIPGKAPFQRTYTTRSSLGYGRPQRRITTALRLRQPQRVILPLSSEQVARFWKGFRTFRDLAIVALMLQDGLRSCEVLQLQLEDLVLSDAHRSRRNIVSEHPAAVGVVESVNLRFKELWKNRSLVFPQLRHFPQRFSPAALRYAADR
jgi:integrase